MIMFGEPARARRSGACRSQIFRFSEGNTTRMSSTASTTS